MVLPTRSCLVCRQRADKPSLTRLTAVDGTVRVDSTARLPGRGAYVCDRVTCLDAALSRGAGRLLRALRVTAEVAVDDEAIRAAWQQTATSRAKSSRDAQRSRSV